VQDANGAAGAAAAAGDGGSVRVAFLGTGCAQPSKYRAPSVRAAARAAVAR
jgi:hypothetical protein